MEKRMNIITGLLVISLLVNGWLLIRIESVADEAASSVQRHHSADFQNIRHEVSYLRDQLSALEASTRWLVDVDYEANAEASEADRIALDVTMAFAEMEADSDVTVQYRPVETDDWQEAEATNQGDASYQVQLTLDPEVDYEYRAISEGEVKRTGETRTIPSESYQRAPLVIRGTSSGEAQGEGTIHFGVRLGFAFDMQVDLFDVNTAVAHMYDGEGERIIEEELTLEPSESDPENQTEWVLDVDFQDEQYEDVDTIDVEVTFRDGRTATNQVYPENQGSMLEW